MDRRIFGRFGAAALLALTGSARAQTAGDRRQHRIVLQVSVSDPALMNLALGNIENIARHYEGTGESVLMDLTAFGSGYVMMRADTSPVKSRIADISQRYPFVRFSACQNSRHGRRRGKGDFANRRSRRRAGRRRSYRRTSGTGLVLSPSLDHDDFGLNRSKIMNAMDSIS